MEFNEALSGYADDRQYFVREIKDVLRDLEGLESNYEIAVPESASDIRSMLHDFENVDMDAIEGIQEGLEIYNNDMHMIAEILNAINARIYELQCRDNAKRGRDNGPRPSLIAPDVASFSELEQALEQYDKDFNDVKSEIQSMCSRLDALDEEGDGYTGDEDDEDIEDEEDGDVQDSGETSGYSYEEERPQGRPTPGTVYKKRGFFERVRDAIKAFMR